MVELISCPKAVGLCEVWGGEYRGQHERVHREEHHINAARVRLAIYLLNQCPALSDWTTRLRHSEDIQAACIGIDIDIDGSKDVEVEIAGECPALPRDKEVLFTLLARLVILVG
jgi:hypothetical protein